MKDVYPQNVEENKKRDEQERLKEKRALKRQQKVDAVTNNSFFKMLKVVYDSKLFFWFGIMCWIYLGYKFSSNKMPVKIYACKPTFVQNWKL